ncbi:single-strand DNA-binding protein [Ruminococcaceae bacterium FB2012]|nr:single-strand DNA-binding protein [Ruminococcaceae bacterium FB2012]
MLNKVILMGRITRDLELKQTPQGVPVLSFSIAVDRNFVKQGEERQADFINCVAWRQQAEFISRYFGKGRMIAVEGNLRTRTYDDQNGNKRYATEVYVDSVYFTGEKAQQGGGYQQGGYQQGGYPQQGGYQNNAPYQGGYQNNGQQNNYPTAPAPAQDHGPAGNAPAPNISGLDDFEVLSDDGVPF